MWPDTSMKHVPHRKSARNKPFGKLYSAVEATNRPFSRIVLIMENVTVDAQNMDGAEGSKCTAVEGEESRACATTSWQEGLI